MKKLYSLIAATITAATLSAQLSTQVVSPGVFKITYGANDDYSLYDPGFQTQTFYIHTWINASQNSSNIAYTDDWSNSNVTMTYDSAAHAYVGTIDLNSKVFTSSNTTVPAGTTVQQVGMVFKDLQSGATKQSADLSANGPTTLAALGTSEAILSGKSLVANGKLYTGKKGALTLSVYDLSGKLLKTLSTKADGGAIDLNISKSGVYMVKVADGTSTEVVKFVK